jgi:hypothetical protein
MKFELGEADLKIGEFSLWIFGCQFPDAKDYWDGNWLNVLAQVEASDARVRARGSIVHLSELMGFCDELEVLERIIVGSAHLKCIEPHLRISLKGDKTGHVQMTTEITPNQLTQSHKFNATIDQSFLKPAIGQLRKILERFPIKKLPDE